MRPVGKKIERLSLLSGGERSLAAVALLVADAIRRSSDYPGEGGVVWAAAALGAVSLLVAYLSSWRQLAVVLAWAVPLTVVGFVLVSAPDALEQVLVNL